MYKKIIAIILVMSVFVLSLPLTASAADGEYISEVRMATGKTAEECRNWLTDNGYTVVEQDLNEGTGENYSYIGYKTTLDPNNAITDVKIMNMNGGFVANDTEAEIQKMQSEMNAFAEKVLKVVDKVRENYENGDVYAKAAIAGLNIMTYDAEMKVPLGDWLMGNPTADELKNIIFFSEAIISLAFFTHLATGLQTENQSTWLEKTLENMKDESKTYSEEAEDRAYDFLYPAVNAIVEEFNVINEKESETRDESEEFFAVKTLGMFLGHSEDESLFQRIMNPDLSAEDLFPMADAISDEQITVATYIGLMNTMEPSLYTVEDAENLIKKYDESEKCYIFEGLDPETFNQPVAMTVNAVREQNLDKGFGEEYWENNKKFMIIESISLAIGVGLMAAGGIVNAVGKGVYATAYAAEYAVYATMTVGTFPSSTLATWTATSLTKTGHAASLAAARMLGNALFWAGVVVIVAFAIIAVVGVIDQLYDYYHPDYTDIPFFMMDVTQSPINGEDIYVTYRSVLDQNGNPGDLNTWQGKAWNAVYITKDQKVGKPIRANMLPVKGNAATPEGYFPIANFGESVAANLNQSVYNNKTKIFLFVERNENHVSYLASAFSLPNAIFIFGGLGLLVGAAVSAIVTTQIFKRRKKQTADL